MVPVARFNAIMRAAERTALVSEAALALIYAKAVRAAAANLAAAFSETLSVLAAGEWVPPDSLPELNADLLDEARRKREAAAAAVEKTLQTRMAGLAISFDPDTFRVFSPSLLEPLAQHAAANFDAELRDLTARAIRESFDAGLSVPDTAKAIRTVARDASAATATMLARTDLIGLANGGSFLAAKAVYAEEETVYKTWLNAHDGRVRPTHVAAGGQTVPLDASFHVGLSELMYPGDPQGAAGEVINCRCTFTLDDSLTAAGGTKGDDMPTATGIRWRSVLVLEGVPTEDGRIIDPGALTWRDLPLTLMAMTETSAGGHEGAGVAGRIDDIARSAPEVLGEGVFDGGELGSDIARLVQEETLRGVSVDLAISEYELRTESGDTIDIDAPFDPDETIIFAITEASIMGATVCPFPAFADANIEILAAADGSFPYAIHLHDDNRRAYVWTPLVASAAAGLVAEPEELALEEGEQGVEDGALGETLRVLYADTATMASTARGYHLNAQNGVPVFEAIYRDLAHAGEVLGEQALSIGARPPVGLAETQALATIRDGADQVATFDMAATLRQQNELLLVALNAAFTEAAAAGQPGIADVLAARVERHQRWSVQLRGLLAA